MTTARSSSRDPSIRNQAPEPARRPAPQPAAGSALQSSTSPSSAVQDRDEEDDAQNQYGNALVTRAASPALESADPVPADDSQLAGVLMSPATMFFAPFIPNIENESTGETDSDVVAEEEEEDEDEEGEIEEEQLESDESEGEAFVSEVADEDVGSEEEAGAPAEQPAVTPEDQRATEMREEQLPQAEPLLESGQAAVATEEETPAEDETPAEEEAVEVESESEAAAQSAESAEGAPERAVGEGAAPAAPEAPTIQAWRAGVRARTAAMPTPELGTAAEAPARVRRAGGAAASTYVAARADANTSAQQAVAPPPHVETPLPPPEPNPVPGATALVDKASDRRLPDQTLPGLQKSPRGSQPTMVALVAGERGTALVPQAPPPAEEDAAAVANPDQTRVDEIQGAAATAVQPQQAQGEPVTLVDQGAPPAPELPPASRSDVAGVIAVVLADVGGEARRMLQDAQREAFPRGLLLEAFPNIGDDIVPELEEELRTQLGEVARLAGISAEEVDAKVRERQETLAQRTEEARTDLGSAGTETNQCVATEAQSTLDATAGARDAVDEHIDLQTEAASGKVDPAVIRSRQQRLNRSISRKVGQQVVAYTQAGERRKKALDDSGRAAQNAYTATARREDQEIRAQVEAEGRTPEEARAESAPGYAWARDRVNEVRTLVADLQRDAGTTATTYESEVRTAGSDAHDLVRAWADAQVAEHSSWWDRLLEMFRNWAVQSHAESEAWEAAHNQAARDGLVRDLALMGTLQQLEANNIDGRALIGQAGITDEQRAVITAYYGEGPDQGNPLVAIAAGLRARIAAQRRPDLIERFKQRVLDAPDPEWRNVALIGTAERAGFDAYTIASQAEEAMSGAGTTEELIFSALASLTPIQAAAVRKCYRAEEFGADLDADLASELGGEELRRAEALLAGDQALADVATLREAIEGAGTDEATIMQVLRGKSAEDRQRIIDLYNQTYDGDDLTEDLKGDLSDHDLDRANALLEGDTKKADAIALDQAMHGGVFGLGTDEDQITQVYTENRQEVEAEGARNGWTTAQIEAEVVRRNQQIEGAYETEYATGEAGERSALRQAFDDELSGPDRNLALALADNDLVKADAARLEIERRGLYTDDDAVNEILRSQYQRARREVQRDLQIDLEQRAQIAALRGEEFDWEGERRTMQTRIDTDSRERAAGYMTSLEDQYDSDYSTWGGGGLQVLIAFHMDGTARDEAQALLRNKGYLTPEEELFYAVEGPGTDEDRVRRVLTGKSPAEIQQIRDAWNAQHPDEPFDDRIRGEFSGREDFDIQLKLEGEPQTPEERLARARRRLEYEQNAYLLGGAFAGPERGRLERQMAALERDEQRLSTMEPGSDEYARAMERFSLQEGYLDRAVSDHRRAVDSATDIAATIAGIVATVVVIVGAVALTIVTGGAAAPGLAAAIAAVMSSATVAATAAGAAAIATVLTKLAFKGGAYGYEDIGIDLAVGAVDAVAAYFTAGLGTKLLGGGTLSKLAGSKSFVPRLIANAAAEGAEGFASSLPSALTGSLANDQNWASGNSVGAIFGQTMVGVGMGTVLSGGLGSLGAIGKPARGAGAEAADVIGAQVQRRAGAETADVLARRGTPVERLAGWRAFRDANPGKAYDDFLRDLDAGIVARQGTDEAVRKLQRQMRGELLSSIPPAQRGQFKDVAIEVVSDADFQRLTRSAKGQAVVLIENGKPRVLLRESVDPRVLRQEGPHLLQTVDPRTAKKVAELDEARLANWDRLPIDEQFRLYRNKIDLEIDGQERLIRSLADDLDRAGADDVARRSLREQLETAQENLDQLTRRLDEVDSITPEQRVGMARGQPKPPQYLDQPPRLFAKKVTPRADPDAPRFHLDNEPSPWRKTLAPGETIHRVGDTWEEPLEGQLRTYRQVEVLDTAGRIKKLRQEIEMPDGSWRQRGSESAARGTLVEEASLLLTRKRAARTTRTQIKSLGVKSQRPGGQGFDEVFFEFHGGKATVVVTEVKDYPNRYVPFEDFTAVTKNLDDNIAYLRRQLRSELASLPGERTLDLTDVELRAALKALKNRDIRLELRLGPSTHLGTFTTGGEDGVIRQIKEAWKNANIHPRVPVTTTKIRQTLVDEAAALPSNIKAHALLGTRPRFHALTSSAASKGIVDPPFAEVPNLKELVLDKQLRLVSIRTPKAGEVTSENADQFARSLVDSLRASVPHPKPPHMQTPVTVILDVSRLSAESRKALHDAIDDTITRTHAERGILQHLHVLDDVP